MFKFNMHLSICYFIISAILISRFECSHHRRSKLHRRQNQEMLQFPQQIPQQVPLQYNPLQQPISQFPVAQPTYPPSPAFNRVPTGNDGFPHGNPYIPYAVPSDNVDILSDNVPVSNNNDGLSPGNNAMPPDDASVFSADGAVLPSMEAGLWSEELSPRENVPVEAQADNFSPFPETVPPTDESQPAFSGPGNPISVYPELVRSYPSPNPLNVGSKRRRKNTREDSDGLLKLFEKEKELLELSAITELSTDKDVTEQEISSVENDVTEDNTTLIPLPEGIQLKTDTRSEDSIIHAEVNITSSTQKVIHYDNHTEIEKVVEMQMERKIEDEKGTGKGYEEVRITEKERIKPMVKARSSKAQRRKRKNHKHRFFAHHRSKRSKLFGDEVPRSKSFYKKLTHRFLTAINRKERVVEPNNLITPPAIPDFTEMNRKATTDNTKQMREDSMYDRKEIDDFMKFFLNEMKKFRKSRENKTNINEPFRRVCKECNSWKLSPYETRKLKKNAPYPEHMNVIMNLNMTWDSEMKNRVDKGVKVKILKEYDALATAFENTTPTPSAELMSDMKNVNEKQNARFLTAVLIFSVITCLFSVSTLLLPKLYKLVKLNRMNPARKTYQLYAAYPKNRAKESERENLFSENDKELEWQSENGDWLSDKLSGD